ncbi:hypothetical protein JX266_008433 [Neoarthrinium moseri]|uniref:uncharacterized protein n=1 Tax=Neoarthrinium moseri TaxID=1658444 RepID=UPI001FDCDBDF|nr:uncharacterized protein JN550_007649 [Neoarthrinium moseri]KAI1845338.1 hypothetical protein JX266_008433 [Neoarthrinium moseri]KAI1866261.1 hypothetical protein JN550_007649 [Neoarthrinium moseri]
MARKKQKQKQSASHLYASSDSATIVQITPYLYLGPRTATEPRTALAAGITHVVSLGCQPVSPRSPALAYHRLGLLDVPGADLGAPAALAGEIIKKARRDPDARVLVHCVGGVSRSPAVLAAYLVRKEGLSLREALRLLVSRRPCVRPNDGFLRQLRDMEAGARGDESMEGVETLPPGVKEKRALLGVEV